MAKVAQLAAGENGAGRETAIHAAALDGATPEGSVQTLRPDRSSGLRKRFMVDDAPDTEIPSVPALS
jgi:hypothetical protein